MSYQKLYALDRASFLLDAQLLSSLSSGTFTGSSSSVLGTQSWNMPAGYKAVITIEQEQILLSVMSISGGTVTCTIDTRGYNGTTAATHAAGTLVEMHLTKAHLDSIVAWLANFDTTGLIMQSTVTAITNATTHTIAADQTAIFTIGRTYVFTVAGTTYRALVTAASFAAGTTTITLLGDGLPASGTVTMAGFEFDPSTYKGIDVALLKTMTNAPSVNPPSGYVFTWVKNGNMFLRDNSGNVRMLGAVTAAVSSSAGVVTLDCSVANTFEITLTENVVRRPTHGHSERASISLTRFLPIRPRLQQMPWITSTSPTTLARRNSKSLRLTTATNHPHQLLRFRTLRAYSATAPMELLRSMERSRSAGLPRPARSIR